MKAADDNPMHAGPSATEPTHQPLSTEFAPAERAARQELDASIQSVADNPVVNALLEVTQAAPLLLNRHRQVVAFNGEALRRLGLGTPDHILGLRPGELLSCVNLPDTPCGCGTGESCRDCGLVGAVLASQETGRLVEQECLFDARQDGVDKPVEIRVRASPLHLGDEVYTFVSLQDISDEKRRQVLERVFLHDVRNTAAGLLGWAQFLSSREEGTEHREAVQRILGLAQRLERELQDQHDLVLAEAGTYQPAFAPVTVTAILDEAAGIFAASHYTTRRDLVVEAPGRSERIHTDRRLVVRVLANMLKNAFEATRRGGRIRLGATLDESSCTLYVQNEGVLTPEVRHNVFHRSFSTKAGSGRGLGTYSMKLFGERYLGGRVGFSSEQEEGTVFFLRLPRHDGDRGVSL